MRISRAGASRSIRRAWQARSSPHAATGSSRSRNSARSHEGRELGRAHARLLRAGGRRPQRPAPAPRQRAPRAAARARGRRAPSAPGRRRRARACSPAPRCVSDGVAPLGLGELGGREAVEVGVARGRPPGLVLAGQRRRAAAARPRARAARAAARAAAARRAWWSARATCWPACDLEAVVAQQRGERGRVAASRRRQLREVLGEVLAQHVADPAPLVRARRSGSAPSSSFWRVIGSVPATSQRTARRSNRNSTARCHASSCEQRRAARDLGVLAPGGRRHRRRAARARRPPAACTRARRLQPRCAAAATARPIRRPRARAARARRRSAGRRGRARRPRLERGELAHRLARLLGVLVEGVVRRARRRRAARLRGRRVEAVGGQREPVALAEQGDQPGAWPGRCTTRKPLTSSPSSTRAGDLTGPPSQKSQQARVARSRAVGRGVSKWK